MCGIAGILDTGSGVTPARDVVERMVAMLRTRGPDGTGYFVHGPVALGHSRLSIIDIEGGAQPIHNPDGSVQVVFNGEIFNYVELREWLEGRGCRFYTHTDTEVIVHLYDELGLDFVEHLNGQFAIALWDANRERLVLARDRAGILPLFVKPEQGRLLFGSEVKAILPALDSAPALNPDALEAVLTFWTPVGPETMFAGVEEVAPGEMLIAEDGALRRHRYWHWTFPRDGEYLEGGVDELAGELHDLLVDATRIRLRADVPVGAYLSGGLDSSAITALVHHYGGVPLRTFSVGFEDEALDESSFQARMIRHLDADHSHVNCTHVDIARHFPDMVWRAETPVLRTAPVPLGILSGLAHDNDYRVVLTGEGADEVLGGYDIFKEGKIRQFWARNPDSRMRPLLLQRLYPYLNITQGQGLGYVKSFFGTGLDQPDLPWFSHLPRWDTTAKCKAFLADGLLAPDRTGAIDRLAARLPEDIGDWHPFNRAQYLEATTLLNGYLLSSQGDRMLMAHSVEGRFPFLDHRVIEFANRLHPRMKMRVLNEKYLLKKAMARYLPDEIVRRHKQPYRAPDIPSFFTGDPPDYVDAMLSPEMLNRTAYFDAGRVQRLRRKIERGRAIGFKDNMALVGILSTQLWHHHFVDGFRENFGPSTGDVRRRAGAATSV